MPKSEEYFTIPAQVVLMPEVTTFFPPPIDVRLDMTTLSDTENDLFEAAMTAAQIILDRTDAMTQNVCAQSEGRPNIDTERMKDYMNIGLHLPTFYVALGDQFEEDSLDLERESSHQNQDRPIYLGYRLPALIEDMDYWQRTAAQNKLGYYLYQGEKKIVWNTIRSHDYFFDRLHPKRVHGQNLDERIPESERNPYYLWSLAKPIEITQ